MKNLDPVRSNTPSSPLLSVLIPTKDRYETLVPVVKEITARLLDKYLEVVICDNSTVCDKVETARLAEDPRVSYYYSDENRSVVDNTEAGIALCRGEYICFIGDDDLISPHIVEITRWLKSQKAECLIYPPGRYWWSSVHFAKESRYQRPGCFWLPKNRSGVVKTLSSVWQLNAVLARGGISYLDLPRLYHGIVSREAMQRVHAVFGRYVPGSSPDMALCAALALTNQHYLSLEYPVTVFGASKGSGGGRTAARNHHGRIADQKHLPADILDKWDPKLPRIWSEQVIYAQTIHEVFAAAGVPGSISYPATYGSLLAYEPHIIGQLWPILSSYLSQHPGEITKVLAQTSLRLAGRARRALRFATGVGMPFDLTIFGSVGELMAFMEDLPPPELPLSVHAASA